MLYGSVRLFAYFDILCDIMCSIIYIDSTSFYRGSLRGGVSKESPYECGFEEFQGFRGRFNIRFYLVAILFIIFDLEIAFFISMGCGIEGNRSCRILFYDVLPCFAYNRIHIRMEEGGIGMAVDETKKDEIKELSKDLENFRGKYSTKRGG